MAKKHMRALVSPRLVWQQRIMTWQLSKHHQQNIEQRDNSINAFCVCANALLRAQTRHHILHHAGIFARVCDKRAHGRVPLFALLPLLSCAHARPPPRAIISAANMLSWRGACCNLRCASWRAPYARNGRKRDSQKNNAQAGTRRTAAPLKASHEHG